MNSSNPIVSTKERFGKSSVNVKCNSLTGQLYYIKAGEFLKAMKRDATSWQKFELH